MQIRAHNALFNSELWQRALDSYARAINLTVKLFDADACLVLGPIHPTPLFQLFEESSGYDPGIFAECVSRCLRQAKDRPAVMVSEFFGLTVIGSSLVLDDRVVGAAVCGYAFVDFAQLSEVERLARNAGIAFDRVWHVAIEQKPVPQRRLMLNGELLQVLGDALLRENKRTRHYGAALTRSKGQLQALGHRLLTSQEDERLWLAQELHDDTLQRIAALQNDVASVRIRLPLDAKDIRKQLQDIEEDVGSISDDIRALSHRLHPSILDDLGLEAALRDLVSDFAARTSQTIQFHAEDVPRSIPPDIATTLYRIAQEALGNIRKHAAGASVTVTLACTADQLRLVVEDTGPGFDLKGKPNKAGLGLISMQERAISVGGKAILASSPGDGTRVGAVIPWQETG